MFGAYAGRMAVVAMAVKAGQGVRARTDAAESRWRRGFEDNQRIRKPFKRMRERWRNRAIGLNNIRTTPSRREHEAAATLVVDIQTEAWARWLGQRHANPMLEALRRSI